jgi:GTP cyclohydrolase I
MAEPLRQRRVISSGSPGRNSGVDLITAGNHALRMLAALGIRCETPSMADTPYRFAKALHELTSGRLLDPRRHLQVQFEDGSRDPQPIIVTGIPFDALCEHHLLPFSGTAAVVYLPQPGQNVVGLSKIARVVQEYARRFTVQERLVNDVVTAIQEVLHPAGAGVYARSGHTCMSTRGAMAHGAEMICSAYTGRYLTKAALRSEFLTLALANASPVQIPEPSALPPELP